MPQSGNPIASGRRWAAGVCCDPDRIADLLVHLDVLLDAEERHVRRPSAETEAILHWERFRLADLLTAATAAGNMMDPAAARDFALGIRDHIEDVSRAGPRLEAG